MKLLHSISALRSQDQAPFLHAEPGLSRGGSQLHTEVGRSPLRTRRGFNSCWALLKDPGLTKHTLVPFELFFLLLIGEREEPPPCLEARHPGAHRQAHAATRNQPSPLPQQGPHGCPRAGSSRPPETLSGSESKPSGITEKEQILSRRLNPQGYHGHINNH